MGQPVKQSLFIAAALSAGLIFFAGTAFADDPLSGDRPGGEDAFAAWAVMPAAELNGLRGGMDVDIDQDVDLDITFTNNTCTNCTSGTVSITDNAFGNLSGFQAIVVNSGNNVAIENALTVTVVIN